MWRLVTSIMIATEHRLRFIYKSKVLLMTFCLRFVVEVAEVAAILLKCLCSGTVWKLLSY